MRERFLPQKADDKIETFNLDNSFFLGFNTSHVIGAVTAKMEIAHNIHHLFIACMVDRSVFQYGGTVCANMFNGYRAFSLEMGKVFTRTRFPGLYVENALEVG